MTAGGAAPGQTDNTGNERTITHMPSTIALITALTLAAYASIRHNQKQRHNDLTAGRCPECSGSGAEYIHANGWIGCDECDQTGTADAWKTHHTT